MDVKSTLRVVDEGRLDAQPAVAQGQTFKWLVGNDACPTDRVRIGLAVYAPGRVEKLHWHPIEALYFVVSGHATVRNIEGQEFEAGPGTSIYAPAGLAGAHGWTVKEGLTLLSVRGTNEERKLTFEYDEKTQRSSVDVERLAKTGGLKFKSFYGND